jgi:hypothetical protein
VSLLATFTLGALAPGSVRSHERLPRTCRSREHLPCGSERHDASYLARSPPVRLHILVGLFVDDLDPVVEDPDEHTALLMPSILKLPHVRNMSLDRPPPPFSSFSAPGGASLSESKPRARRWHLWRFWYRSLAFDSAT